MNRCSDLKKRPTNLCRRTELGYRTVQHVVVVEEVNDWRQQKYQPFEDRLILMLSICRRTVHSDPFLQVFTFWELYCCPQVTRALLESSKYRSNQSCKCCVGVTYKCLLCILLELPLLRALRDLFGLEGFMSKSAIWTCSSGLPLNVTREKC